MIFKQIRLKVEWRIIGARLAQNGAKKVRRSILGAKGKRQWRKRHAPNGAVAYPFYRSSSPAAMA